MFRFVINTITKKAIVLYAMADAKCCFTYIDVGANGRASDAIFRDSTLNIAMESNLRIPELSLEMTRSL